MKFKVENGSNHIAIGLSDLGSYFRFNKPLSFVWWDCGGGSAQYYCVIEDERNYQSFMPLTPDLNFLKDYSSAAEELYTALLPLITLFKNGNYELTFAKACILKHQSSTDNFTKWHEYPYDLHFTKATSINWTQNTIMDHQKYLAEIAFKKNFHQTSLMDYTTYNLYDSYWNCFYATKPKECIRTERVKHYEELIAAGERPIAIVMQAYVADSDLFSSSFVIDGHHKLIAYTNLNVLPTIAFISYLPSVDELEFDVEQLSTVLYPWQTQHVLTNWEDSHSYITEKLQNPKSPLQKFYKDGNLVKPVSWAQSENVLSKIFKSWF